MLGALPHRTAAHCHLPPLLCRWLPLCSLQSSLQAVQEGENDKAEIVIVCEPEGMSLQMGGLHPRASLYEKPVNLEAAKQVRVVMVGWRGRKHAWHEVSKRETAPAHCSLYSHACVLPAAASPACRCASSWKFTPALPCPALPCPDPPRPTLPPQAHAEFRRVMREKGVRVLTVREILAFGTADHVGARVELEEFAMQVGSACVGGCCGFCCCWVPGGAAAAACCSVLVGGELVQPPTKKAWPGVVPAKECKVPGVGHQRGAPQLSPYQSSAAMSRLTAGAAPHHAAPAPPLQALTYRLCEGSSMEDIEEKDRYYLSDAYKRTVLQHMSVPQLIDTILINPTVNISPSYRDTGGWGGAGHVCGGDCCEKSGKIASAVGWAWVSCTGA